MEHGDEENTPAQIPLYNTPQNIQEFAYQERTLVKYNKFVIVIAIFGVIVFGTMSPVFAKGTFGQNDKEAGIYIVIGLVCGFILFELFIQFFALGLKVDVNLLTEESAIFFTISAISFKLMLFVGVIFIMLSNGVLVIKYSTIFSISSTNR